MTYRSGVFAGVLYTLIALAAVGGAYWLVVAKPAAAAKTTSAPAPATVSKKLDEEKITTITLTPEALQRLALTTGQVEMKPVRRTRVYGGEIMAPAGQTVIVSAPITGTLKAPEGGVPQPGQKIKKGQALFQLIPLLTPDAQVTIAASREDALGQLKSAEATMKQSENAVDRAQKLVREGGSPKRILEEAERDLKIAQATFKAAQNRVDLLDRVLGNAKEGTAAPITIECPEEGVLQKLSALPGQQVPAGAALFEVSRLERVWVRVPVYGGDQPEIDSAADAEIGNIVARLEASKQVAKPVAAPPSANPATGTVDLFYELDNRQVKYSPGQRVGVTLVLQSEAQSLTVPWKAVVMDVYGGHWVYERTGEKTFVRQRVVVRNVAGDLAVLASGPAPGTKVVTNGAAELFGAETGFTK